ncbi:hypothetical protein H0H93_001817 [Arthromyces matolae]|nr:hypothetical protein H0H93_001817 [Arthromyces matolae]
MRHGERRTCKLTKRFTVLKSTHICPAPLSNLKGRKTTADYGCSLWLSSPIIWQQLHHFKGWERRITIPTRPIPGTTADTDKDSNDDDEEEDGGSSEPFEGKDLREDLEEALQGDFDFEDFFYYGALAPTAPNPCLSIEGPGRVGLPLSARDARAIIDVCARATFGIGSQTVVNSKFRDTWEIEPSKVKFENPAWTRFIHDYMIPTVWQGLGMAAATVPPKCELHKLLLYEPGSQWVMLCLPLLLSLTRTFASFLPHQDTEKENGIFARATIILPSPYTGGEVHVSHSSTTKVLAFASDSLVSTTLLAWYTGVVHEVKPVKSGYCLALSYDLIHTVPGIPKPVLPDVNEAVSQLRHVLRNWQKSAYKSEKLPGDFVTYLLNHKYSEANLQQGQKSLKGTDAHLVTNVEASAQGLGYNLYLANLEYCVTEPERRWRRISGTPDDSDSDDYRRCCKIGLTLKDFVDLEGSSVIGNNSIAVSEGNLIPKKPFEGAAPDHSSYQKDISPRSLVKSYRRSVLIIIHEENVEGMMHTGERGADFTLYCLGKADPNNLSAKDRRMVNSVLISLNADHKSNAATMFEYALKWKDIEIWKMVVKKSDSLIATFGVERLVDALKVFGFESVRQTFEDMLPPTLGFGARVEFIQALAPHAEADESDIVQAWTEIQTNRAVASFHSPSKEDIPILISMGQVRGSEFLVKEILPQLTNNTSSFEFVIAFVKALHENKGSIPEQPPSLNPDGANDVVVTPNMTNMIETLLNAAAAQWSSVVNVVPNHEGRYFVKQSPIETAKIQRIISIIETCLLTTHMTACNKLFLSILKMPETPTRKFRILYTPLIPQLRNLMNSKAIDLCFPPISEFLQLLVGSYLRDVLGAPPPTNTSRTRVRKIGCKRRLCYGCDDLDRFILSNKKMDHFPLVYKERLHLEAQLCTAPDLVSFVTLRFGSPYRVQVTKVPQIVALQEWEGKAADAKEFLLSIGDDSALERLMGNRFEDVQKALSGAQPFIFTVGDAERRASTQARTNTKSVVGVKRKRKNATGN